MTGGSTHQSRRLRLCRLITLLFAVAGVLLWLQSPSSARQASEAKRSNKPHVVVILTGGLRWDQLDEDISPNLSGLAASGMMANLVPIATRGAACPIDTWLAMSAGEQISQKAVASTPTCTQPPVSAGSPLPEWDRYTAAFAKADEGKGLGKLAEIARLNGISTRGIGNGSAYALADGSGRAPRNFVPTPNTDEELAELVSSSASASDLTIVDADAESYASDEERQAARLLFQQQLADQARQEEMRDRRTQSPQPSNTGGGTATPTFHDGPIPPDTIDGSDPQPGRRTFAVINTKRVEKILDAIPSGTRVVVASTVDIDTYTYMQMYVAADKGEVPGVPLPIGFATSDSVHRTGVVQTADVVPTILHWYGIEDATASGIAIHPKVTASTCDRTKPCYADRVDDLRDQALHSGKMRTLRGPFIAQLTTFAIGFFLASLLLLSRPIYERTLRHRWASILWSWGGLTLSAIPLAGLTLNVFPWWRASNARIALFGGMWTLAAAVAALALVAGRRWRTAPLLLVPVATATAIAIDTATQAGVMADSPIGFNLLAAARFYGIGNEAYALLTTGTLLGLAFFAEKIRADGGRKRTIMALSGLTALGLAVAVIDGLPSMGADFGGILSFLPALCMLILLVARTRLSVGHFVLVVGLTVAAATAAAVLDWLRDPPDRTHLGNFVESVLNGELAEILTRKLDANFRVLFASSHRWVILAAAALVLCALLQLFRVPDQAPGKPSDSGEPSGLRQKISGFFARTWGHIAPLDVTILTPLRKGTASAFACLLLASALNDSGIAIMGTGSILAVPGLVALWLEQAHESRLALPGGKSQTTS